MDTGLVITIVATVAGWGVTFGICKNKIEQNQKDIEALKSQHKDDFNLIIQKQNNTDTLLQNISNQLTELNTQVRLLIKGRINLEGGANG